MDVIETLRTPNYIGYCHEGWFPFLYIRVKIEVRVNRGYEQLGGKRVFSHRRYIWTPFAYAFKSTANRAEKLHDEMIEILRSKLSELEYFHNPLG